LLGWTVSLLPVPREWDGAMTRMTALGARACGGEVIDREELLDAALEALKLPHRAVEALLTWGHR
jgi:hypothetical protein